MTKAKTQPPSFLELPNPPEPPRVRKTATGLGRFQREVLEAIVHLKDDAHPVQVLDRINAVRAQNDRDPAAVTVLYETATAMELAGLIVRDWDVSRPKPGGRRRRLYRITTAAVRLLREVRAEEKAKSEARAAAAEIQGEA